MTGGIACIEFSRTSKDERIERINPCNTNPANIEEAKNLIKILHNDMDRLRKEKLELYKENSKLKRQVEIYEFEAANVEKWAAKMKRLFNKGA